MTSSTATAPRAPGRLSDGRPDLRTLDSWVEAAHARRVGREERQRLFEIALGGAPRMKSRDGESYDDYRHRWAMAVLGARWLTTRRLSLLTPTLTRSLQWWDRPDRAAEIVHALTTHPAMTPGLLTRLLGQKQQQEGLPAQIWTPMAEALRRAGHPWAFVADLVTLRMELLNTGRRYKIDGFDLDHLGKLIDPLDETSGRILLGMLPAWTRSFAAAVASARDVADNPDPELVAEDLTDPWGREQWLRVFAHAKGAATTEEQLLKLPLDRMEVWSVVAGREDLTTRLRARLYDVVRRGPQGLRGHRGDLTHTEWADLWASHVFAARWMTGKRLTTLVVAAWGVRLDKTVPVLVGHPNVNAETLVELVRRARGSRHPGEDERVLEALATSGTTWAPLAAVIGELYTARREVPDWRLQVGHPPTAGRALDRLKVPADVRAQFLALLPTWTGDLPSALAAATPPHPSAATPESGPAPQERPR